MSRSAAPSGYVFLAAFAVVACPVDERTLVAAKLDEDAGLAGDVGQAGVGGESGGGGGGAPAAGAGGGGGDAGGAGGEPASGGAGGEPPVVGGAGGTPPLGGAGGGGGVLPCEDDVNVNGVLDCLEGILQNARFDDDGATWQAEVGASTEWEAEPPSGASTGALAVTNAVSGSASTSFMAGAGQCVAVTAGEDYSAFAAAYLEAGQAAGASAGLSLWFYSQPACSGTLIPIADVPKLTGAGSWGLLSQQITAPAGAFSLRVRLVVSKKYKDAPVTAFFDNVLVVDD